MNWRRGRLKRDAKKAMGANFLVCVVVGLMVSLLVNGPLPINETLRIDLKTLHEIASASGSADFKEFIDRVVSAERAITKATSLGESSSEGLISDFYHQSVKAGSAQLAVTGAISNFFFRGRVWRGTATTIGLLLSALLFLFFNGIIQIGVCRFFLENRRYAKTGISRVFYIYRLRRTLRTARIIGLKYLYLFLWILTIVGFPIRYFSYYLVDYIVAENPDVSHRDVFRLSCHMMRGHKWRVFLLEFSFLPWRILSLFTFGLLQYLYVTPYLSAVKAELYMSIRKEAISEHYKASEILTDPFLEAPPRAAAGGLPEGFSPGLYPVPLFAIPEHLAWRWLNVDYHVRYRVKNLILLFFLFSLLGWGWECTLNLVQNGTLVNRGSLYGPWLPIYGVGSVSILVFLRRFFDRPILTFFLIMALCGLIEYGAAWALEDMLHLKYWDYSGYFFNIQGRVCLEGLLVFGLGGFVCVYTLAPILNNLMDKLPENVKSSLCGLLIACFGLDLFYTIVHPHTGKDITH